jgi:hypothetical protein
MLRAEDPDSWLHDMLWPHAHAPVRGAMHDETLLQDSLAI